VRFHRQVIIGLEIYSWEENEISLGSFAAVSILQHFTIASSHDKNNTKPHESYSIRAGCEWTCASW